MVKFLLRPDDAHKGMMGHSLLIVGRYGMAGAGILAAKACLRSGVGKVTVHIPKRNNDILQISVPEAIVSHDSDDFIISDASVLKDDIIKGTYRSIAVGPGIGTDGRTAFMLKALLSDMQNSVHTPLVLDADALNILSQHVDMFQLLPENTILTPHPAELHRLLSACVSFDGDVNAESASIFELHSSLLTLGKDNASITLPSLNRSLVFLPCENVHPNKSLHYGKSNQATSFHAFEPCPRAV